jgi:hypothetical protein
LAAGALCCVKTLFDFLVLAGNPNSFGWWGQKKQDFVARLHTPREGSELETRMLTASDVSCFGLSYQPGPTTAEALATTARDIVGHERKLVSRTSFARKLIYKNLAFFAPPPPENR